MCQLSVLSPKKHFFSFFELQGRTNYFFDIKVGETPAYSSTKTRWSRILLYPWDEDKCVWRKHKETPNEWLVDTSNDSGVIVFSRAFTFTDHTSKLKVENFSTGENLKKLQANGWQTETTTWNHVILNMHDQLCPILS